MVKHKVIYKIKIARIVPLASWAFKNFYYKKFSINYYFLKLGSCGIMCDKF